MDCVGGMKNQDVASGLFRALKAHANFIGNSPFKTAPP